MSAFELENLPHVTAGLNQIIDRFALGTPARDLAEAMWNQLPLAVPTKIGAVVRTSEKVYGHSVFVRVKDSTHTEHGNFQWVALNDPDTAVSSTRLGRIIKVLSEGVDL